MDIISSIKLKATGGDQAAQEVGKVKKAFDAAADSANKIKADITAGTATGVPGVPGSPAEAAVSEAFATRMREKAYDRDTVNARKKAEAEERENKNTQQKGGRGEGSGDVRGGKGRLGEGVAAGATAIKDIAAGDPGGAVSEVGRGIQSIGTGPGMLVGGAIAGVGAALLLQQTLAKSESSRVSALWGTGMSQRMNLNYDALRAYTLKAGASGIPEQATMQMLEAYTASGGTSKSHQEVHEYVKEARKGGRSGRRSLLRGGQAYRETENVWDEAALMNRGAEAAMAYGVAPSIIGRTMGVQMQAGYKQENVLAQSTMGIAEAAFGRGLMGRFINKLADATEMGMTKGMIKGSDELVNVGNKTARMMSAFTQAGVTPAGAEALTGGLVEGAMNQSVQLKSPAEFRRFMRLRKPGESYFDTLKTMTSPDAAFKELKVLQKEFRGNPEGFKLAAMSTLGMDGDVWGLEAKLAGFEKWKKGGVLPGAGAPMPEIDQVGRARTAGAQTAVFEKFESSAADMVAAINRNTQALAETYGLLSSQKKTTKIKPDASANK